MGKAHFEYERFKVQLKLAINRINTLQQKHQNTLCGRRKEVADLLKNGQEERARLLVKYLVRDDYLAEVYDMIHLICDDLARSAMLIAQEKECDESIVQAVKSIIYAAGRVDIPELARIKEQLLGKYGKDWADTAAAGADQRLVVKLGIKNPDSTLVNKYLQAIAEIYKIPWATEGELDLEQPAVVRQEEATSTCPTATDSIPPPPPYTPSPTSPSPPSRQVSDDPDFDELTKRFEALKGRK